MVDPNIIQIVQHRDRFRDVLDVVQAAATIFLGAVALLQMRAANRQATAADSQAEAAKEQLDSFTRPKLYPMSWTTANNGGTLKMQNDGKGTAYCVRWRFDKESNWTDGENAIGGGGVHHD